MMILLSKKEYDDLIKKSQSLELLVEQRVDEEKKKISRYLYSQLAVLKHVQTKQEFHNIMCEIFNKLS